jgi:hypothetical protein
VTLPTPRFSLPAAVAALATLLSACELNAVDTVQVKAAENFRCPRESVRVVEVEKLDDDVTVYEARGCNETMRYACELVDEQAATREGPSDRAGGRTSMRRVMRCRAHPPPPKPEE